MVLKHYSEKLNLEFEIALERVRNEEIEISLRIIIVTFKKNLTP